MESREYISYEDLKSKARELGITTSREYHIRYKKIKGAPRYPEYTYIEWTSWNEFLRKEYISYKEFQKM